MLEAENYPNLFSDVAMPKRELLEINRSKISFIAQKQITVTQ
jgi:hypothetical protein